MWKSKITTWGKRLMPLLQKYRYAFIILLAGLLMLLVGSPRDEPPADPGNKEDTQQVEAFSISVFQTDLQKKLSLIAGAGQVEILLSMEDTEEVIYASNTRQSSTGSENESYESNLSVLSDGSYGEQPVRVKSMYPTFRGAVVLCEGADKTTVRLAITEAVSTVCGLGTDKITVLKMEKNQ